MEITVIAHMLIRRLYQQSPLFRQAVKNMIALICTKPQKEINVLLASVAMYVYMKIQILADFRKFGVSLLANSQFHEHKPINIFV